MLNRISRTPYAPILRHPALRRLLPAMTLSAVGDGMSFVAISWLTLQLAPPASAALWVGVCSAAAVLPGVALTLARPRAFTPTAAIRVARADALLHAATLGAIPLAHGAGILNVQLLALLLALSAPLRTWGFAARFTLIATALPNEHRIAGNAALSSLAQIGVLTGPALAGLLIATTGAVSVLAVDAATFAILALAFTHAARHLPAPATPALGPDPDTSPSATSARAVLREPAVAAVIALTAAFFALYGPLEVALPVHVVRDLHAPATVLASFVTVFGIGALIGGLAGGYLARWPATTLTPLIVTGWGLCLLPLGLGVPTPYALVAFGLGALIFGPYTAVTTALVQANTPAPSLPRALAAQAAVMQLAVPLGTLAGAPLVAAIGAQPVVAVSAIGTMTLGAAAGLAVLLRTSRASTSTADRPGKGRPRMP